MSYSSLQIWLIIIAMGIGTYAIRFSFLGLIGDRKLPDWILRHLRYTPVAILPALVAPAVIWPEATDGAADPARLIAAALTLAVGYTTKSLLWAIVAGIATFATLNALI